MKDRFLVGAGNLYSGGAMGGEATHTLTQGEMPNHNHIQRQADWQGSIKDQLYLSNGGNKYGTILEAGNWINGTGQGYITTTNTGGDQPHNNLPPYLAVFIWKRTG